jgi:hypothetical protein
LGPLPVLQTLRDKEPFYWLAGFWKERVIVLGRASALGDGASGSDAPVLDGLAAFMFFNQPMIEEHIQDFCSAWFIVSGQSWVEFSLVSSSSLKISSSVSTLATLSRPNFWRFPVSEFTRPRL